MTEEAMRRPSRYRAWPDEVVVIIALFVPESADFAAFLEANREMANLPEPLESLYQLGLMAGHTNFWPILKLRPDHWRLDKTSQQIIQSLAKYYSAVEWYLPFKLTSHVLSAWSHIRIMTLDADYYRSKLCQNSTELDHFLAHFNNLTTLKISMRDTRVVDAVFAFAAQSRQLTHLELTFRINRYVRQTTATANNIIDWFHRQPVRVFKFSGMYFFEYAMKQVVVDVIFNCPTLETLEFSQGLQGLNFTRLTLPMATLKLHKIQSSTYLWQLFQTLVGSGVRHLTLKGELNKFPRNVRDLHLLFETLNQTPIETLEILNCRVRSYALQILVENLPRNRQIHTLILKNAEMTNDHVELLGMAIQNNHSINTIDLSGNDIDPKRIKQLILACTQVEVSS
ncbi:hypothetical protein AC1031_013760 [Aphanomyces cochlioides]|nr:hypothetical protein AC1031_013760 [Aphanomyces cochlioides]